MLKPRNDLPAPDHAPTTSLTFGAIMVTLTLVGWSSIPLFLRHFAEMIDPWTSNGWRYGFSALLWAPVLVIVASRRGLPPGLWKAAIMPSIVNAAGQVCFTYAHYLIDPGLLAFGLRSQLLFVAVGAWMLFPMERKIIRTRGYLGGGLLLVAGMVAVIAFEQAGRDGAAHSVAETGAAWGSVRSYAIGVALAIGSGGLFAAYALAVRKYMHGMNSVVAFAAICQYTAAVMVGLMLVLGAQRGLTTFDLPPHEFMMLLLSAVIGIALGHVFYYISIARLGVAVSSGVLQLQPFLVALAALPLFSEVLTAGQWIGGCIAVSGAMLMLSVQYRMNRRRERARLLADAEGRENAAENLIGSDRARE